MNVINEEITESYLDFEKICRVCLETHAEIFDIYSSFYAKRSTLYSDMLLRCTKLSISKDDGLPQQICKDCSRQLKRTYIFNLQCEASDKKLKCYLRQSVNENNKNVNGIKEEKSVKDEKITDFVSTNESLLVLGSNSKEIDRDIKVELAFEIEDGNDSSWDAEDDICLLQEIKPKKEDQASNDYEDINDNDRPKKKRGRKKKLLLEGDALVPDSKMPHQCDICGKFLSNKSNLKAHKICHTNLRPYECPDCPATFRGHSALFQHRRIHSGETPYHCEYCPKQFRRRTNFVNHVRIHTGEKLFSCEVCCKTFVQSAQLSIHMKRHKGEKTYLCQDCGKGFPIKGDLRVHQRIHNGEKPYSCHLCDKTFATAGNLSIHVRIHNKEVRYHCKECQRGFVTCSAFNLHMKRHKGQRDHHCECGKTFYTSSALKQHKVVHTGEKKYQCKICDRKFTQTSHLSRHFKRDHLKPNAPVPSSDKYKIVIQDNSKIMWSESVILDSDVGKIKENGSSVKCEGT